MQTNVTDHIQHVHHLWLDIKVRLLFGAVMPSTALWYHVNSVRFSSSSNSWVGAHKTRNDATQTVTLTTSLPEHIPPIWTSVQPCKRTFSIITRVIIQDAVVQKMNQDRVRPMTAPDPACRTPRASSDAIQIAPTRRTPCAYPRGRRRA